MILVDIIALCETACTPNNIRTIIDLEKPNNRSDKNDKSLGGITIGTFSFN